MDCHGSFPDRELRREICGYLDGTLSPDERASFELRLWTDVEARDALISEFRFRNLVEGALAGDEPEDDPKACRKVGRLIGPYLRGRIEPGETGRLARHLNGCPACQAAYEVARLHPSLSRYSSPLMTACGLFLIGIVAVGIGYVAAPFVAPAGGPSSVTFVGMAAPTVASMLQALPDLPAAAVTDQPLLDLLRLESEATGDGFACVEAYDRAAAAWPEAIGELPVHPKMRALLDHLGLDQSGRTSDLVAFLVAVLADERIAGTDRVNVLRIVKDQMPDERFRPAVADLFLAVAGTTGDPVLFEGAVIRLNEIRPFRMRPDDLLDLHDRALELRFTGSYATLAGYMTRRESVVGGVRRAIGMLESGADALTMADLRRIGAGLAVERAGEAETTRLAELARGHARAGVRATAAFVLWRWTAAPEWETALMSLVGSEEAMIPCAIASSLASDPRQADRPLLLALKDLSIPTVRRDAGKALDRLNESQSRQ